MGLTFQQKFYQVPEEVYLVQFLEPGDMSSARAVVGIVEKPEDEDLDLHLEMEARGYCLQKCNFDDLIREGFRILREEE